MFAFDPGDETREKEVTIMEWTSFLWISGVYWALCLIYILAQVSAIGERPEIEVRGELPQPA
ncbi:MAG: hypothetical protein JRK53_01685 [Deltaproteobacteria bacterium]|nr:hypothetical protein [Deltaproteobacteria bacterium]